MLRAALAMVIAATCGLTEGQTSIRYEFEVAVIENTFADNAVPGAIAGIPLNTAGSFSIEVDSIVPPISDGTAAAYSVLGFDLSIAGFDAGEDSAFYPSSDVVSSFNIVDNVPLRDPLPADSVAAFLRWDNAEIGLSTFFIGQEVEIGEEPTLFTSFDLPREVDLSLANVQRSIVIQSKGPGASGNFGRFELQFTSVDVVLIPAPSAAATLMVGVLALGRRR
ncbi:MAG: hypothetical protein AAFS11_02765 [Planctomycetota bacterium]